MRALTFLFALSSLFLFACPPAKCSPSTCATGCCDASGQCQTAQTSLACGTQGAMCTSCALGTTCSLGVCQGAAGGGAGGGGGGGSTGGGGGSLGGGAGGGGGTSNYAALCQSYAEAYVGRFVRCGALATEVAPYFTAQYASGCSSSGEPAGLRSGRSRIDQAALQSCLDNLRNAACDMEPQCNSQAILVGLGAADASCFEHTDCQPTLMCDTASACPGRCVARIAIGQPVTVQQACVPGAYAYNGSCRAYVPAGQSCAPTGGATVKQSCVYPNVCNNAEVCAAPQPYPGANQPCATGVCAVGTLCNPNDICAAYARTNESCDGGVSCQQGLYCAPSTTTCTAYTLLEPGASCSTTSTTSVCNPITAFCNAGTCAARRSAGQTCTTGSECATTLVCTANGPTFPTGTCEQPHTTGGTCVPAGSSAQCSRYLYCAPNATDGGTCQPLKGGGVACASSAECQSGSCPNGLCVAPGNCVDRTP